MTNAFTAGQKLTAAFLNSQFKGLAAPEVYTPTFTASTVAASVGNATISGLYATEGKYCDYEIFFVAGSTTTFGTGNLLFSLPFPAAAGGLSPMGQGQIIDASAGVRNYRTAALWTSTQILLISEAGAAVTNVVPWTWAVSDTWQAVGRYRMA